MREARTIGRKFNAEIELHTVCKYVDKTNSVKTVTVTGIEYWEIVDGEDAVKIEEETDGSCIDDFHEYLVLHLQDGNTATFRNSYVDMFRTGFC